MKETVFVTMILRATLVDSASLSSVLLSSGKMFHRQEKRQTRGRKFLNSAKCSPVSLRTLFAGDGNVSTSFSNVLDESVVVALCKVIVTQNILKQYSQPREVGIRCPYPTHSGNRLQQDSKAG